MSPLICYAPGDRPLVEIASSGGMYQLRAASTTHPSDAPPPVARLPLQRGDVIGFERAVDGSVRAIAGEQRFPLPRGKYIWYEPRLVPSPAEQVAGGVLQFGMGLLSIPLVPIYLAIAVVFPDVLPRC